MASIGCFSCCILAFIACLGSINATMSYDTLVDFRNPKVKSAVEALVQTAQSCTKKTNATPQDVAAYFTNTPPLAGSGRCFAACMLEQSGVISHGQVKRDVLLHLAGIVNGPDSRVVRKLTSVSRMCLDSIEGVSGRCQVASAYNDCLNQNMREFAFPEDIAEEAVRRMPFRVDHAKQHSNLKE